MLHDSDVEVDKENFRLGKDTDAALGREDEHNLEREEREEEEELVRRHSTEEQERALVTEHRDPPRKVTLTVKPIPLVPANKQKHRDLPSETQGNLSRKRQAMAAMPPQTSASGSAARKENTQGFAAQDQDHESLDLPANLKRTRTLASKSNLLATVPNSPAPAPKTKAGKAAAGSKVAAKQRSSATRSRKK